MNRKPCGSDLLQGFSYAEMEVTQVPRKPKRPCSFPGCPRLTDGRFCPEHEKLENKRAHENPIIGIEPKIKVGFSYAY